ncbi:MAG: hypothetical protein VB035_14000 [Candidatus Fimivivens sp.]|nr:hypothetical protein [Candidatus Fimivivens sp.]
MIGITEDGYPIVTGEHSCPHWAAGSGGAFEMRECWYCRYADFREPPKISLENSICHCPSCRITRADEIRSKEDETV